MFLLLDKKKDCDHLILFVNKQHITFAFVDRVY